MHKLFLLLLAPEQPPHLLNISEYISPAETKLIFRFGRTIKSKKISITYSLHKNSSVPPTSAMENPLPRQKPPLRTEILLPIPPLRIPFHVIKPARYGL